MGSIVAEIADKIASAGGGERSELEIRGGTGAEGGGILTLSTSELTVVDGDKLGRIDFRARAETGADALLVSASIWAEADDVFDASGNETEIVFAVGTAGTAVAAEVVRIDHDGQLGIGVATPASLLHVAGTVQVGVDDTGHDVIFYGDAAGALAMWDTSADSFIVRGATADHATDSAGRIVLQTNQAAVVDGDIIGRIDWNAPAEHATDGNDIAGSIWVEAEDTFSATVNESAMVFATGVSGVATEEMRLLGNGRLGIGTSAPDMTLHIRSAENDLLHLESTDQDCKFKMEDNGTGHFQIAGAADNWSLGTNGRAEMMRFSSGTGVVFNEDGADQDFRIESAINSSAFSLNGADGSIGIGTTSVNASLNISDTAHAEIELNANAANKACWLVYKQGGTSRWLAGCEASATHYYLFDVGDNAYAVHLQSTNHDWTAGSDERMKKDIVSMEGRLDDLLNIEVRRFKWKRNDRDAEGFIAQELLTHAPEAVEIGSDEVWSEEEAEGRQTRTEGELKNPFGVAKTALIPMMIKSIQELSAKVTALEDA